MAERDREKWDTRYAAVGPGEPVPPGALEGRLDLLPDVGRALDVACGRGAVAVWLAQQGFSVDAVDVSGAGLAAGAQLAARTGVGERVSWTTTDLDPGLPARCTGPYDVVVCQRFRDPSLYPRLDEVLASDGLLVMSVLSEVGVEGGRFRAHAGELADAFGHLEILAHDEVNGEANLVARKPQ